MVITFFEFLCTLKTRTTIAMYTCHILKTRFNYSYDFHINWSTLFVIIK